MSQWPQKLPGTFTTAFYRNRWCAPFHSKAGWGHGQVRSWNPNLLIGLVSWTHPREHGYLQGRQVAHWDTEVAVYPRASHTCTAEVTLGQGRHSQGSWPLWLHRPTKYGWKDTFTKKRERERACVCVHESFNIRKTFLQGGVEGAALLWCCPSYSNHNWYAGKTQHSSVRSGVLSHRLPDGTVIAGSLKAPCFT